ncbi:MAG: type II toxin-antitoxin system HicA family toxin [Chitinophagaceae bacterium]
MSKSPAITPKELIKLLERKGFVFDRSKGSHQIYYHKEKRLRAVIPAFL